MRITAKLLIEHGAAKDCKDLAIFRQLWPQGGEVTLERCLQAARAGLNIRWAVEYLLPERARAAFDKAVGRARAAFDEATAPAKATYEEAVAPARAEFDEATAPAWVTFDEATAPAWATYKEATAPAKAEFDEAVGRAFFNAVQLTAASAAGGHDE